jgi:hypothetical protein
MNDSEKITQLEQRIAQLETAMRHRDNPPATGQPDRRQLDRHEAQIVYLLSEMESADAASIATSGSGVVIGSNGEPPEAGYSATTVAAGQALDVWVSLGVAYYESGAKTLYGYKQQIRLFNATPLSAPVRYTIDVAST